MSEKKRTELLVKSLFAVAFLLSTTGALGQKIVGMSIACSNDHVYTWYEDRTVTAGTSSNLGAYQPPHSYSLPAAKTPDDILGIGIAGNDHVYVWYRDGTATSGTSTKLDQYRPQYAYSLASGKSPVDVAGIDIACSNDHVYVWYRDGKASSGTSDHLDKYRAPYSYSLPPGKTPADILETGIAGNDHVYAWYRDRTASSGTSDDLDKYRAPYSYVLGRGPCAIYANPPDINRPDRMIFGMGSRGPSCETAATVKVSLKRDISFWPDPTLDTKTVSVTNGEVVVKRPCSALSTGQVVYVEIESEGHKVQSKRTAIQFCN